MCPQGETLVCSHAQSPALLITFCPQAGYDMIAYAVAEHLRIATPVIEPKEGTRHLERLAAVDKTEFETLVREAENQFRFLTDAKPMQDSKISGDGASNRTPAQPGAKKTWRDKMSNWLAYGTTGKRR